MADRTDLVEADTLAERTRVSSMNLPTIVRDEDRYEVEGVIGRGGMGVVSAYYDRRVGRRVACKELRRDVAEDATSHARFLREARVQGQLEHPAIVPVYDIGQHGDGAPYFTMKTVRGVTLAEVIARLAGGTADKQFALHRLLSAFSRICLAIEYAHERGVLHRDLKPANLILGEYGEVYVLDWGLAKIIADTDIEPSPRRLPPSEAGATSASTLLGTPGYMAPEQMDDPGSVGPAADVYALAVILFELLTLQPLHERGLGALHSTRVGVEVRPSVRAPERDVAPELEALIVRATAMDPEQRGTAREMSEVVERYLEGERDLELRRAAAAEHARAADHELRAAFGDDDAALDARRRAMQDINRALVLDPENADARGTMVELMSKPPVTPPPELVGDLARQFRRDIRWISGLGASLYASMIVFLPIMWWMGVRQWWPVLGFAACMLVTGTLSVIVSRSKQPSLTLIGIAVVTSCTGFAIASRLTSPIVLVPAAIVVNATGYAVLLKRTLRIVVMVASSLAFLIPVALELSGAISPSFAFEDGQLRILPVALEFPEGPALAIIAIGTVAATFLGTYIIGHIRERLADAEYRVLMYAWHLGELVPGEVRSRTDPMKQTVNRRPK